MRSTVMNRAQIHVGPIPHWHRLLFVVLLAAVAWMPVRAEARGAPDSFADLAEKLLPAVVNISTTQKVAGRTEETP